ncbi:DUF5819 family protein [Kitasatospora sp. NBC_01560]|uniref:DUF5819 family protein n=1 Tax=Kitasatospora sp. NBC_01560 TaxID=2975965 RepID=UPI0038645348
MAESSAGTGGAEDGRCAADAAAGVPLGGRSWSRPALAVLGVAGAALVAVTGLFLAAVFLHVAPANSLSREYREQVDGVVYPEFEQNWKLFAPNPLQQNVSLDARVRTVADGGATRTHDWFGLTARDLAAIRGNPAPSHADQNLLRRAWDFYEGTHSAQDDSPTGPRGKLAEQYLKRIALQRTGRSVDGERILEIEFRVTATVVRPPDWSGEAAPPAPKVRELPWWPVNDEDHRGLG